MSPLLCIDSEKLLSTNLENYSEATFALDPNINTGCYLTSHQTVPKIEKFAYSALADVLSNYAQRI